MEYFVVDFKKCFFKSCKREEERVFSLSGEVKAKMLTQRLLRFSWWQNVDNFLERLKFGNKIISKAADFKIASQV